MRTSFGHISYCSNIHPGDTWQEHFKELQTNVPTIKNKISSNKPFGIGLRLSDNACKELSGSKNLIQFKNWLTDNNCYVFTVNGFPFGNFHQGPVKDNVYAPDWTKTERVNYTVQLFDILKELVPGNTDGSISTSPLAYRHWFNNEKEIHEIFRKCTLNILQVIDHLVNIYQDTGKILHLDIEPEPDGLLEDVKEFIQWFNSFYMPMGLVFFEKRSGSMADKTEMLRRHLRLCYDVCHSAIAFEKTEGVFRELKKNDISVGKVQISSAIKVDLENYRQQKIEKLSMLNEPTYLHQVIARDDRGGLHKFKDLPEALGRLKTTRFRECRVHFHIPIFYENYDLLSSTQDAIIETLSEHSKQKISNHWEVETYTWKILPAGFQLPLTESIIRELEWVLGKINTNFFFDEQNSCNKRSGAQ